MTLRIAAWESRRSRSEFRQEDPAAIAEAERLIEQANDELARLEFGVVAVDAPLWPGRADWDRVAQLIDQYQAAFALVEGLGPEPRSRVNGAYGSSRLNIEFEPRADVRRPERRRPEIDTPGIGLSPRAHQ